MQTLLAQGERLHVLELDFSVPGAAKSHARPPGSYLNSSEYQSHNINEQTGKRSLARMLHTEKNANSFHNLLEYHRCAQFPSSLTREHASRLLELSRRFHSGFLWEAWHIKVKDIGSV